MVATPRQRLSREHLESLDRQCLSWEEAELSDRPYHYGLIRALVDHALAEERPPVSEEAITAGALALEEQVGLGRDEALHYAAAAITAATAVSRAPGEGARRYLEIMYPPGVEPDYRDEGPYPGRGER